MTIDQFAVSEFSTLKWSFEEDVEQLTSLGVKGIGVWRHKLEDYGDEKSAELLIDSALPVSSLQWAGEFTGSGPLSFKESIEDTLTAIAQAALIGSRCLIIHPGSRNNHTESHAARLIRNAIQEVLPVARDYGITLALEPSHAPAGRDWSFLHQLDGILELIGEFGSRNLGVVYDTFQMGDDVRCLERLRSCIDQVCLVQIADSHRRSDACGTQNRLIPGDGELQIREMICQLADNGYDGFYELEVYGAAVQYLGYPAVIERAIKSLSGITAGIQSAQRQSQD